MNRGYKFRLYPTDEQKAMIDETINCCRFVYNRLLERKQKAYLRRKENISAYDLMKTLPHMKEYAPFLKNAEAAALQQTVLRMDSAYQNWWKAIGRGDKQHGAPKFKSRNNPVQTYKTTNMNTKKISPDGKYIKLPKIGYVRCVFSQPVEGKILSATVIKKASGKYYISLCCDIPEPEKLPVKESAIGLVFNTSAFAEDSNGVIYDNPKFLEQSLKKLAKEQQRLSRKQFGSSNWQKQRVKVARLYEDITNQRADHHHKLSTEIIRNNQLIFVEDINLSEIVQVTDNSSLNREIYDASWGEFVRQLEYKAEWYGRTVIKVPGGDKPMTAKEVLENGLKILSEDAVQEEA